MVSDTMVKTTIDIDDERWKRFSIKVIEDFGGRKKNDVIEGLLEGFLKDPKLSEALDAWMTKVDKPQKRKESL
jgi:hypothetical protein